VGRQFQDRPGVIPLGPLDRPWRHPRTDPGVIPLERKEDMDSGRRPAGHPPPRDQRHHHYQSHHAFYNCHAKLPVAHPPKLYSHHSMFSAQPPPEIIAPAKLSGRDPVPAKVCNAIPCPRRCSASPASYPHLLASVANCLPSTSSPIAGWGALAVVVCDNSSLL
jgi:hypothetical protein